MGCADDHSKLEETVHYNTFYKQNPQDFVSTKIIQKLVEINTS